VDIYSHSKFSKEKIKLYKIYLSEKSPNSSENYLKYKNYLTKTIRAAEKKYSRDKFNSAKDSMKDTWKLINSILQDVNGSGKKSNVNKIQDNGQILED
jgi:hypothetical protein